MKFDKVFDVYKGKIGMVHGALISCAGSCLAYEGIQKALNKDLSKKGRVRGAAEAAIGGLVVASGLGLSLFNYYIKE